MYDRQYEDLVYSSWEWKSFIDLFTPKISLVILLPVCYTISCDVSLENLVSDQLIIPELIFFFILVTCLLDIVWILWGEILSWSLMGVKGLNKAALTPNHLISPYNITSKSHIKVTRIKETITEKKKLWMVKKILP